MANKKVSQLTSKPSVLVTDLFPIADPSTGQLYKTTISDLGTAIGSGVSSVNTLVGAVVLDTDDIQELASPTNKWFTDTRARAALSTSSPLTYNSGTGAFGIQVATGSQNGYLSSTDWTTFNGKQAALSGTGFVKISGTTISYDNNTYLTTTSAASTYVDLTNNQTIIGVKTFISMPILSAGSGVDGQIIYANGSNVLKTIGNFKYNDSTGVLTTKIGALGTNAYTSDTYALDSAVVKLTGAQTIAGIKTFQDDIKASNFLYIREQNASTLLANHTQVYANSTYFGFTNGAGTGSAIFTYNGAYNYTLPASAGTLALTSQLSSYLPLSGGTLTGALSGTSASFSSTITATSAIISRASLSVQTLSNTEPYLILSRNSASNGFGVVRVLDGGTLAFDNGATGASQNTQLSITAAGVATFAGALNGTSATFTSSVVANNTSTFSNASGLSAIFSNGGGGSNYNSIELRGGTVGSSVNWQISKDNSTANAFELAASTTNGGTTYGSPVFKIVSTGAATFSSSVTTTGLMVNLSSQFTQGGTAVASIQATGPFTFGVSNTDVVYLRRYGTGEYQLQTVVSGANGGNLSLQSYGGNVGIGTTAPSAIFHVVGTSQMIHQYTGSPNTFSYGQYNTSGDASINNLASANLLFATANTERMRITSTGYVATTSNTALQNVPYLQGMSFGWNKSNGQGEAMINWTNAGGGTSPDLTFNYWNNSTLSERMRITSGGQVLINTTTSTTGGVYHALIVKGTSNSSQGIWVEEKTNDGAIYIDHNGSVGKIGTSYRASTGFTPMVLETSGSERIRIKVNGIINFSNVPTSSAGLSSGDIYKSAGVLMIV